jgi:hypothetical protein
MRDALESARLYRLAVRHTEGAVSALRVAAPETQILLEMGRSEDAVALADAIARAPSSDREEDAGAEWQAASRGTGRGH